MNPSGWNVCVIEPNKFERQNIIVDVLRNAGVADIKEAPDGEIALELLRRFKANVIIAAFELPSQDGAAWTREFRRNKSVADRKAAIFITSGAFSLAMAEQCRHAGANALIGKPLSAKVLIATITKVLAKPRPFIDAEGYVGPCRRAGIVTAGAPKKRRKLDAETPSSAETLASIVAVLADAVGGFCEDGAKADACEAALRQVQAYAVNAGDGALMRACAAFALQIKACRAVRNKTTLTALKGSAEGVVKVAMLNPAQTAQRSAIAESVREIVAKAALQRAA